MDFLTERTIFKCSASPSVDFKISTSGKVTHKNSKVLTTATKLSGNGICTILTAAAQGVQQFCQFQQTTWLAADFQHKAGGENLLTQNSFCTCPIPICAMSPVKVFMANSLGFHDGHFSAQVAETVAELPNLKIDSPEKSSAEKISDNKFDAVQENDNSAAKNINHVLKCSNCDKKDCNYKLKNFGKFSAEVDNKSAKLLAKYKKYLSTTENYNAADIVYIESLTMGDTWSYAAHHIISGNQVFAQVPELVKFATACEYDINCAENCIMLPSKREGHGELDSLSKSTSAFDVMSLTGMQWHLGGHTYSFNEDELNEIKRQIKLRIGREGKVQPYAELVKAELKKIKLPSKDKPVCPAQIITRLNNISNKIREKLAAFKDNPAASYPYYVSREAYLFAFKVPRLKKFIVVKRNVKNLLLERYKTVGAGNEIVLQESLKTNQPLEIVNFCGNIQHFIFADDTNQENLPFPAEFSRRVESFNFDNVAEIIVWLRENPIKNYVAPARKVSERLKNLK